MPSTVSKCKHCGYSVSSSQSECPNCSKAPHRRERAAMVSQQRPCDLEEDV
ncbi:hypothetical protein B0I35DRAFT_433814, partial [Stachybotrys elegans]